MKKILFAILAFAVLSCNKSNSTKMSDEVKPLKAVINYTINGMTVTLDASKSEGDVCAYGWGLQDSPLDAFETFSPNSSAQGDKRADGSGKFISGTCKYIPIVMTVSKKADYTLALEVKDSEKNSVWAYQKITIK